MKITFLAIFMALIFTSCLKDVVEETSDIPTKIEFVDLEENDTVYIPKIKWERFIIRKVTKDGKYAKYFEQTDKNYAYGINDKKYPLIWTGKSTEGNTFEIYGIRKK